jgi:membrane-associated phospholipid phosphatase
MLNHQKKALLTRLMIGFFILILTINKSYSQTLNTDSTKNDKFLKFKPSALIAPSILFTYGIIAVESDYLKVFNTDIREEVLEHIDKKITIDDFSQYSPMAAVYGLNLLGVKGKNNFKNRTLILATSYLLMGVTVNSLKKLYREERPDMTSRNSFPSGHTATAFMGAEFLYQEYKDKSIWYGITGYVVAAGTGAFRIYNNRHWLNDVVAGAAIGILSTKTAYWLNPYLGKKLFKEPKSTKISYSFMPSYNQGLGFKFVARF